MHSAVHYIKTLASNFVGTQMNATVISLITNHAIANTLSFELIRASKNIDTRIEFPFFTFSFPRQWHAKTLSVDNNQREYVAWHKSIIKAYNFSKFDLSSSENFRGKIIHRNKDLFLARPKIKRQTQIKRQLSYVEPLSGCYSKNPFVSAKLNISAIVTPKQSNFVWF